MYDLNKFYCIFVDLEISEFAFEEAVLILGSFDGIDADRPTKIENEVLADDTFEVFDSVELANIEDWFEELEFALFQSLVEDILPFLSRIILALVFLFILSLFVFVWDLLFVTSYIGLWLSLCHTPLDLWSSISKFIVDDDTNTIIRATTVDLATNFRIVDI